MFSAVLAEPWSARLASNFLQPPAQSPASTSCRAALNSASAPTGSSAGGSARETDDVSRIPAHRDQRGTNPRDRKGARGARERQKFPGPCVPCALAVSRLRSGYLEAEGASHV